jgi:hypothetical protein
MGHDEHVSREQAAERLADIAYALTAGGTLELRTEAERSPFQSRKMSY